MLSASRPIPFAYIGLIAAAPVLAATRLSETSALPGLQAIEVVLLALPWSLALGVEPLARAGWWGMVSIVSAGLLVNVILLGGWLVSGRHVDAPGSVLV